jgi:hypothetical protein
MSAIFINYRRDDSAGYAGRLFDNLVARFGRARVFMDIETLEPGLDFVDGIDRAIRSCGAVIAIIGPNWIKATNDQGQRRLEDPTDFIRLEISAALRRGIRVIPVLVHKATMPTEGELPESLRKLCRLQSFEISDNRWEFDVGRLADVLTPLIAEPDVAPEADAASRAGNQAEGHEASPEGGTQPGNKAFKQMIAAALLLTVAAVGGSWWFMREQPPEPASEAITATSPEAGAPSSPGRELAPPAPSPSEQVGQPAVGTAPQIEPAELRPENVPVKPASPRDLAEQPDSQPTPDEPKPQPEVFAPARIQQPDPMAIERQAEETARLAQIERITDLLDRAQTDLAELRLTRPAGNNAYERYRQVLEIDPENTRALEGLQAIVERYHGLVEDAISRNAFDTALRHVESVRVIAPGTDWLPGAESEIERQRLHALQPREQEQQAHADRNGGQAACLGRCEEAYQHCRETTVVRSEALCLKERAGECEARYEDCMSDVGKLLIWGQVSQESECAGIHARCEREVAAECANPAHTSGCDNLLEQCVEECRTAR